MSKHLGTEYANGSQALEITIDSLLELSIDSKIDYQDLQSYYECATKDIDNHTFASSRNIECLKKVGFSDLYLNAHQKRILVYDAVQQSIDGRCRFSDDVWIWLYGLDPTNMDLCLTEQIDVSVSSRDYLRLGATIGVFQRVWILIGTSGYHRGLGVSLTTLVNLTAHNVDRIRACSIELFLGPDIRFDRMMDTLMFMTLSSLMKMDTKGHQHAPQSMQNTMQAMALVIPRMNDLGYHLPVDMMVLLQDYLAALNMNSIDFDNKVGIVAIVGLFFELVSERSDSLVQQSLCNMLNAICSCSVGQEERNFVALVQLHRMVIERTPNMIGYILKSLIALLQKCGKEMARSNHELILETIKMLASSLAFIEVNYWFQVWECIKTTQDCTTFQKDIIMHIWSEGIQLSTKTAHRNVTAVLISMIDYIGRGVHAKSDGRDRSLNAIQSSCFAEMLSSLAAGISKDPLLVSNLNPLLLHIIQNYSAALTAAIIDLDHSSVILDPSNDLEYLNCLGALSEYDMFSQLFKAYRQFRNDTFRLYNYCSI